MGAGKPAIADSDAEERPHKSSLGFEQKRCRLLDTSADPKSMAHGGLSQCVLKNAFKYERTVYRLIDIKLALQ